MACHEYNELMSARLDGTLTPQERERLDEHLASCPACAALMAQLEQLSAAMPEQVEAPAGFTDRVMDAIRTGDSISVPKKRNAKWGPILSLAAVFALVVIGGQHLLQEGGITMKGSSSADCATAELATADAAQPEDSDLNPEMERGSGSLSVQNSLTVGSPQEDGSTFPEEDGTVFTEEDYFDGEPATIETVCGAVVVSETDPLLDTLRTLSYPVTLEDGTVVYYLPAETWARLVSDQGLVENNARAAVDPSAAYGMFILAQAP